MLCTAHLRNSHFHLSTYAPTDLAAVTAPFHARNALELLDTTTGVRRSLASPAQCARSIQSARDLGPLQNFLREAARSGGAVSQDLVDVVRVGRQFGPLGAGGGEVIPVVFK